MNQLDVRRASAFYPYPWITSRTQKALVAASSRAKSSEFGIDMATYSIITLTVRLSDANQQLFRAGSSEIVMATLS